MPASPLASDSAPESVLPAPRAFGCSPDDLDLDPAGRDRPAATTAVIAQCCACDLDRSSVRRLEGRTLARARSLDSSAESRLPTAGPWRKLSRRAREELAWSLPLGERIARLLRIVELTTESNEIGIVLTCPHASCRTRFEVALPFAAVATEPESTGDRKVIPFPLPHGGAIALRLPTGRDQARWRSQPYATPEEAVQAIVQTLAVSAADARAERCRTESAASAEASAKEVDPAQHPNRVVGDSSVGTHPVAGIDLAALSAAMEAADPLVAFSIRTTCPQCEQAADIGVDLEAVALSRLARHRRSLLKTVHALATRYGWSEADVLTLPSRRRVEYLRLIEDENPAQP